MENNGIPKYSIINAVISQCEKYRYSLTRVWDETKKNVMFVMLNPSTADGTKDDPTIRRCVNFAKSWGYGGLYVCNLFAYRATNPKELLKVDNPVDEYVFNFSDTLPTTTNNEEINRLAKEVDMIICAWGNKPIIDNFKKLELESILLPHKEKLFYLELSKDGIPKHPLYLKSNLKPIKIYE